MLRPGKFCDIRKRKGIQILFDKGPPTGADTGTADKAPVAEEFAVCDEMQKRERRTGIGVSAARVSVNALVVTKRLHPAKERLRRRAALTWCLGNQQQWRSIDFLTARLIWGLRPVYFLEGVQLLNRGQGSTVGHGETRQIL